MNGPSPHLSWPELACWNRLVPRPFMIAPYPIDWRETRLPVLAQEFEEVRAELARRAGREVPITINSAYRTAGYNARLEGASPKSQHVEGRALDMRFATKDQHLLPLLHEVVTWRSQQPGSMIRGIGRYNTFVHMDVRPSPTHVATWDLRSPKGTEHA